MPWSTRIGTLGFRTRAGGVSVTQSCAVSLDFAVSLGDLPEWLPGWCLEQLGSGPAGVLFQRRSTSAVFGLRLADGTRVVVKARADDGRAVSCVAAQAGLVENGFPCARPLTPVVGVGALAVHAEEFIPGGEVLRGDSPEVAVRYAEVFARLMAGLADLAVAPPLPNPRWVRWDHPDPGLWPSIEELDERDQSVVPAHVVDTAARARRRLLAANLPRVLGHADFEAHNLRWRGRQVQTVHDWDSLAWQPEAALVGAASAVFPKMGPATLPPVESTEAFLAAYQDARGRSFTAEERQIAWAASLWPAAHDIRWESLHGYTAVSGKALWTQAAERLRRANA
jgi:Phosphotransferase enzyme family